MKFKKNSNTRRQCMKIPNQKRRELIEMVYVKNYSVLEASKLLNLNYSTSKGILRVFRNENRVLKKKISIEDSYEKLFSINNEENIKTDYSSYEIKDCNKMKDDLEEHKPNNDLIIKFTQNNTNENDTHHFLNLLNEFMIQKEYFDQFIMQQKQDIIEMIIMYHKLLVI